MEKFLIKNTTKEQRKATIKEALDCGGNSCKNCSGCGVFGAIDPYVIYQPYIDEIKEIHEINREFNAH